MFRLLWSHKVCAKTFPRYVCQENCAKLLKFVLGSRYNSTSQIKTNFLTYIKEFKPRQQIRVHTKPNYNVRPKTLILGGTAGISLGVSLNYLKNGVVVRCNSDRVSGLRSKVTRPDDGKFDWAMFWRYLKPHLLKFIGAVAVRLSNQK